MERTGTGGHLGQAMGSSRTVSWPALLASRNYNEETGEGFYINLDTGEISMNNARLKGEIESKRAEYGLYVSITPGGSKPLIRL